MPSVSLMDLKTSELMIGIPFICIVGSAFHFLFEWTGHIMPTAWLFAANESVWEHTKMIFFPMIIHMLITYPLVKEEASNIFLAKIVQFLIGIAIIMGFFYIYTAILGDHYLLIDIGLFALAITAGPYMSYKIQSKSPISKNWQNLSAAILVLMIVLVIWWTYDPPKILPFQDSNTLTYGPSYPT